MVDPSAEVLDAGEGALSSAQQVVAVVASPTAIDASGASVPVALTVEGNLVALTLSPSDSPKFPMEAEVAIHLTGPLHGWYPEPEDPGEPSQTATQGVGLTSEGLPMPITARFEANSTATGFTAWTAGPEGNLLATSIPMSPTPGTISEGVEVQAPVGPYAPKPPPTATASCFLGICAGVVHCAVDGPEEPAHIGPNSLETYAVVQCNLSGDLPPNYGYERGGACLLQRLEILGHVAWEASKCNEAANPGPEWNRYIRVARSCPNKMWFKGEAWGGPVYSEDGVAISRITASIGNGHSQC